MNDAMELADERHLELETLEAIYPEIQRLEDNADLLILSIELPVHPASPVTVTFPATPTASGPAIIPENGSTRVDTHELAHLPSVVVQISLPSQYPSEKPPSVNISSMPPWIPHETTRKLEEEGARMWKNLGQNLVAFDYIDHVQQSAERVFDLIDGEGTLKVDSQHKIAILDYDIKARQVAFERETFDCGICLEPKKGAVCHRMLDCAHVFCTGCLQDFYNTAINEGDLATVRCLMPNCAKERAAAQVGDGSTKKQRAKTSISPSELLQIGLSQEMVTRYVSLKYKNELESDKNTIYCPRSWCDGAARSKKHKKPEGLELAEAAWDESDEGEGGTAADKTNGKKKEKAYDAGDRLAICEDCGFAFCSRCSQSWHGEFVRCTPKRTQEELTEEEKASLEYLHLHTSPCPTCAAPAQKTHGCNHMICFRCNSHFCYLCSSWLDPSNPYKHFNAQPDGKSTSCYMRLWELEAGDGNDVDYGFAGGFRQAAAPDDVFEVVAGIDNESDSEEEEEEEEEQEPEARRGGRVARPGNARRVGAVAREGPLVLRIGGGEAAPQDGGAHGVVPPAAPQRHARGRGGRNRADPGRAGQWRRNGGGLRGGDAGQNAQQQRQQGQRDNLAQRVPVAGNEAADRELNPQQEAWIRNFVQMALLDEEDGDDDAGH